MLAARHRQHAGDFAALVRGTADWSAPSPVAAWTAGDVVDHLLDWLPGFLAVGGIKLPAYQAGDDRIAAWHARADAVQALLDDPAAAQRELAHPMAGTHPLAEAIDSFYTTDVFLHAWDLARASGQPHELDPAECAGMLAGMEQMEDLMRGSGQFGPRVAVPNDAPAQDRLIGFIGRDPAWGL